MSPSIAEVALMQHDEFIGQVQARARLSSRGDAERAVRATLETLAERIAPGLADNLAAQLPEEIGEHLRRVTEPEVEETGERFNRDEFITRVSARAGTGRPQAAYQVRVVFELLDDATSGGVMNRVRAMLPDDIAALSTAGSSGTVPADRE